MSPVFGKAQHPQSGVYWWSNEPFVSVSSILGVLNKPLVPAAAKEAAAYADANWEILSRLESQARIDLIKGAHQRKWGAAAELGSEVHHATSEFLENGTEFPPHLQRFYEAFMSFVKDHRFEVEYNEVTVYNRKCAYAGSLDLIGDVDGVPTILDIKTGGVWPEAALQICAYSRCEFLGLGDKEVELPKVEKGVILQLSPKGDYTLHEARIDDVVFTSFRHLIEAYRWQKSLSREVFTNITRSS